MNERSRRGHSAVKNTKRRNKSLSEKIKYDGDNLEVKETDIHVAEPVKVGLFG